MYRLVWYVAFVAGGCALTTAAQAQQGWMDMGSATVLRWKSDHLEYNDSLEYGTNYPGSVNPGGLARVSALACRGWARDIARDYYKVSKWSVGTSENTWPSTDQFNKAYSFPVERVVRARYNRWTTMHWTSTFIPLPYWRNHCRVTVEHYAENIELDSGQDFEQGDVMYWLNDDASNNPDMTGAAIQASAEGPLAGKAAHVGVCSAVNSLGECYALFHAHDFGRLEGIIGHRGSWTLHVGKYLYEELQAGIDGWGVKGTHSAIPENVQRDVYVFRSCNQNRIDGALSDFYWKFENSGTLIPSSERLYRVAAFTQTGTDELEYGQCSAASESMWNLSVAEGGNALSFGATDYEDMVGDAWDNAHDFLNTTANTFWEGLFGNERRVTSAILHAFTDTGKTWNEVKSPNTDAAARQYAMDSAADRNPSGLANMNSPVYHYLVAEQLGQIGCYIAPGPEPVKGFKRSDLDYDKPLVFNPEDTPERVDDRTVLEPDLSDLAFGGDGPEEDDTDASSSPCEPGTVGILSRGEATGCYGAILSDRLIATTASCVELASVKELEVSVCDEFVPVSRIELHRDGLADIAKVHLARSLSVDALEVASADARPGSRATQHNYFAQDAWTMSYDEAVDVYGEKFPVDWGAMSLETAAAGRPQGEGRAHEQGAVEGYPYSDAEGSPIVDSRGQLIGLSVNDPGQDDEVRAYVSAAAYYDWLAPKTPAHETPEVPIRKEIIR